MYEWSNVVSTHSGRTGGVRRLKRWGLTLRLESCLTNKKPKHSGSPPQCPRDPLFWVVVGPIFWYTRLTSLCDDKDSYCVRYLSESRSTHDCGRTTVDPGLGSSRPVHKSSTESDI